jgi:3-phenylpropionate/trans-cinnamate dioxygenase ferredoxin reductase component
MTGTADQTYVIVGASLAGARAAEALRDAGFDGRIVLVGEEPDRPYERPPLSKEILLGKADREKAYVHPETWYVEHQVDLRLGTEATAIDREGKVVALSAGDDVSYDRLLLATGSSPRTLDVPQADLDGIHYLRRVGQSENLRDAFGNGGRIAVVGAGWIGLEVTAAARRHGVEVTVIEPQPHPLNAVLGEEIGAVFGQLHRDHGVDLRTSTGVEGFEGSGGRVTGVRTSTGDVVQADLVVVGVGIRPNVELAEVAGLAVDNGVLVDELLQTSDPSIWAAGDVANAINPLLGTRVRVEHWANADGQGKAAGRSMAGRGEPYAKLPYFFTDQYDLSMEYHGFVSPGDDAFRADRVVLRGTPSENEGWVAFWLAGSRVLAGMNVNDWDAADGIKKLVRAKAEVDPERLADPGVPLDEV